MSLASETKVSQIMQTDLVTIGPNNTIYGAAGLTQERNVSSVLVVDESKKLLGLVTDRQIVVRAVANGLDLNNTTCQEIMTKWPMTISPDITCSEALDIMGDYGYRRLPVESNGKLVGIISITDIGQVVEFNDKCVENMIKELSNDIRYR